MKGPGSWWKIVLAGAALFSMAGCQLANSNSNPSPGTLTVSAASLTFSNVQVGSNQKQTVTVTNTGGSSVTVSQVTISGTGFSLSGLTLPLSLAAGASTSFSVVFTPTAAGNSSGMVSFTSTASGTAPSISLTGAAVAASTLTANPTSLSFGTLLIGSSKTTSETITNSGTTSLTVSQAAVTGAGFSISGLVTPLTLTAGQSASFNVTFAPQSSTAVSGNIAFSTTGSTATTDVSLSGTGTTPGMLGANPTSVSFGSVQVGSSSSKTVTITNTGGQTVNVTQAAASGSGFSLAGLTLPFSLTGGQKYTFTVTFTPAASGSVSGNAILTSDASNPSLAVPLTGTGATPGQLAVTSSLSFGSVTVGTTKSLSSTLSASGASVTVTGVTSNNTEFTYSGLTLPLTMNAGQSQPFTVTFSPQASGTSSGSFTFASNATNPPTVESLTGSGTAPVAHSVDLSWTASTSTVAGYNVYRGGVSGGPYSRINSGVDPSTIYTDSTVLSGQTYYYVVTAVDGSGTESAYSNQVQAVIPTP